MANKLRFKKAISILSLLGIISIPAFIYSSQLLSKNDSRKIPKLYTAKVIQEYPHNRKYFTQGLLFNDGIVYESTGLQGKSKVVLYQLEGGKVINSLDLEKRYFGEGLTLLEDRLFQLTYKARRGFIYDKTTLKRLGGFNYKSEGWGIANDGRRLILSDGSYNLFFLDPVTFKVTKKLPIKNRGNYQYSLNELEYIDGLIYANIWHSNKIIQINPRNGKIVGEIDLSEIAKRYKNDKAVGVLNGIAWDEKQQRLFVTGKRWPHLYHIELEEKSNTKGAK